VSIQDLYNDEFDLYNYDQTGRTDMGGVEKTAIIKQANISCYSTKLEGDTFYLYGKTQVIATHRIFCNLLADIKSSDKIYIHGPAVWADILFIDNCNEQFHHLEIVIKTIQAPEVD